MDGDGDHDQADGDEHEEHRRLVDHCFPASRVVAGAPPPLFSEYASV
jgi:hypothetical protein